MDNNLQREILFFQNLSHDEKLQMLGNAGLLKVEDDASEEVLNEIIANNIEQLQGEPITIETTPQPSTEQPATIEIIEPTETLQPATIVVSNEKPITKKEKESKENKRLVITVGFSGETANYVQKVIDAHLEAGLCTNNSDFATKVFDFAINLGCFTGKQLFGVPEKHEYKLLKNGFTDFLNATPKITVCK